MIIKTITYLIYTHFFLFILSTGIAQNNKKFQLDLHYEIVVDDREIPEDYLGSTENAHFFLYSKGKYGQGRSSIVKFNSGFIPTKDEIDLTGLQEDEGYTNVRSLGILKIENQLLNINVISTRLLRKFIATSIDLDSFKTLDQKEISTVRIEGYNVKKSFMRFLVSPDTSCLGLFYTIPTGSNENRKFSLIVFDLEFNKLNQFYYEIPLKENEFVIHEGVLLNENNLIILAANNSNIPLNPNSNKPRDYEYSLLSLEGNNIGLIGKIPNDNKWLNNLNMIIDDKLIKIIGLYSNKGKYDVHGTFYHQIDRLNQEKIVHKLTPFTKEILLEHYNIPLTDHLTKKKIKKHKELPYYVIKNTLKYEDGSILVISEQMHTLTVNFATTYFFENLLVTLLDADGNVQWTRLIKKDNTNPFTAVFSSYRVFKSSGEYYVIYNGNSRNIVNLNLQRYNAFSNDIFDAIILIKLNKTGDFEKVALANKEKTNGYRIRPQLSNLIKENEILLFSQKPGNVKHQRFMTLIIN